MERRLLVEACVFLSPAVPSKIDNNSPIFVSFFPTAAVRGNFRLFFESTMFEKKNYWTWRFHWHKSWFLGYTVVKTLLCWFLLTTLLLLGSKKEAFPRFRNNSSVCNCLYGYAYNGHTMKTAVPRKAFVLKTQVRVMVEESLLNPSINSTAVPSWGQTT